MADKVGVFNRLGWASGASTATIEFMFLEGSGIGLTEQFIDANYLHGSRSHVSERVVRGNRDVSGSLSFAPSPVELETLLPLILGAPKSGTTFALAESLPESDWLAVRDGTIWHYNGCLVDSATFSASEGGPLNLSMSVVGKDEVAEGSMGAVTYDVTGGPYTLMDCVLTAGGTTYQFSSIEIGISNAVEVKHRNSRTATVLKATDRQVTVSLPVSQGDASALYGSALAGLTVVATFTNGNFSCVFSFVAVQAPKQPLPFGQRGILDFPWRGVARKTSATRELIVTNDATP